MDNTTPKPQPNLGRTVSPKRRIVKGATENPYEVIHDIELDWWANAKSKYLSQYRFDNIADLQDLDRLLQSELLSYRWGYWLANEADYDGASIDEKQTRDSLGKKETEIRLLKKHMGMDRKGRIESETQSIADYLSTLKKRAKEFGIHRNNQVVKVLDLFADLETYIGLHDRTDDQERAELHVTEDDIMAWIRETAIPEYQEIDDEFRKVQTYWIREVN